MNGTVLTSHASVQEKLFVSTDGARSFHPAYYEGEGFPHPKTILHRAGPSSLRDFGEVYTQVKTSPAGWHDSRGGGGLRAKATAS